MQAIRLRFRPIALSIPEERRELYGRMKSLLERAEAMANAHPSDRVRLKAMEVAVKIAGFLTGVLKNVQLEDLQAELERLEAEGEGEE